MTAVALPAGRSAGNDAPRLSRLTRVELRKMTDTRAGFWLLIAIAAITLVTMIVSTVSGDAGDHTWNQILQDTIQPSSFLLPVVGVLLVSSEWSQRTAQITFALVPRRSRVLVAKTLAALTLSLGAYAFCLGLAAIGSAVAAPEVGDQWSMSAGLFGQVAIYVVSGMLIGVAFGAVFLASAPAIVVFFVLPTAFSALGSIEALEGVANWTDQGQSMAPLYDHLLDGTEWGRIGTTMLIWLVLPAVIGAWRFTRRPVG